MQGPWSCVVLIIDVAHMWWQAWHTRGGPGDGPVDVVMARISRIATGWHRVIIAMDAPPYVRSAIWPAYKAHREADAEGRAGLRVLRERLAADGWTIVSVDGHEADDVCATLAARASAVGEEVTIVSADKDMLALLYLPGVSVAYEDGGSLVAVSPEDVRRKFGCAPEQIGDLLAIMGDASDGITGVKGIGKLGAQSLLAKYVSLDGIFALRPWEDARLADERKNRDKFTAAARKAGKSNQPNESACYTALAEQLTKEIEMAGLVARVHASRDEVTLARQLVTMRTDLEVRDGNEKTKHRCDEGRDPERGTGDDQLVEEVAGGVGEGPLRRRDEARQGRDSHARGGEHGHEGHGIHRRDAGEEPRARRGVVNYNFHANDATRESILLRAGLCGPTGSGKTKTALVMATRMVERLGLGPVYVIDSENKSALRYAYSPRSRQGYRFKHVPMPEDDYSPAAYVAAMDFCEAQGAGVIVIDSLSHAWNGINGVLEQVDQVTERSRSRNAFAEGWKTMTPIHNRMIQRITGSGAHVIFTLRAKTDWVIQENERGKREPMKVGLAPVQRDGVDYEPDLFFDMTVPDNVLVVSKSRCDRLTPGETIKRPDVAFVDVVIDWITDTEPPTGPRTLGEALAIAVAEGIMAAEEKNAERYRDARSRLASWCASSGVSEARAAEVAAQFKERVGSGGKKEGT